MIEKMKDSKMFFWSVQLLVIATLILVMSKINFLFQPIVTFFTTLFAPILLAGFLYYLLQPLVDLMTKHFKLKKNLAIALVFLFFIVVLLLFFGSIIPNLVKQLASLAGNIPDFIATFEEWLATTLAHPLLKDLDYQAYLADWNLSIGTIVKNVVNGLSFGVTSFISSVASFTVVAITVPFILFYMLKDGDRLVPTISKVIPEKSRHEVITLLGKMSQTIAAYISGQALECLFVAVGTMLGYWLIGIEYAFLFGCIAGLTNMVPYLGPYLGLAPALFVTIFDSPVKAVLACLVVLVIQQIDGNIIYPLVIGKSLDIHPLTIIIVLLVAGNLAGLVGMILGVPFYAVCKTIVVYLWDIVKLRQQPAEAPRLEVEQAED